MYGSFRTLTDKIRDYLTAANPGDLFAKILERLEGDFETGVSQRFVPIAKLLSLSLCCFNASDYLSVCQFVIF